MTLVKKLDPILMIACIVATVVVRRSSTAQRCLCTPSPAGTRRRRAHTFSQQCMNILLARNYVWHKIGCHPMVVGVAKKSSSFVEQYVKKLLR